MLRIIDVDTSANGSGLPGGPLNKCNSKRVHRFFVASENHSRELPPNENHAREILDFSLVWPPSHLRSIKDGPGTSACHRIHEYDKNNSSL
jgi:hypothetical protein